MSHAVIGRNAVRRDALDKVRGTAMYTSDITLPGMAYAAVVRSPHPHARIVSIDASAALAMPGVRAVAHYGNTPHHLYNASAPMFTTVPGQERVLDQLIFDKVVRFVGDEAAAVAADTPEQARAAADAIKVEYELLPAVYDAAEAMRPEAPELHGGKGVTPEGRNIPGEIVRLAWGEGDIEDAFRECDEVDEGEFVLPVVKQMQMETQAAVAQVDGDGKITIWSTTQTPHPSRYIIASAFDVPASAVRVLAPPYIGGGFGVRIGLSAKAEVIAVALARLCGRPVKCVFSREEDFIASDTRHGVRVTVRLGAKKDGTFHALDLHGLFNTGAYCSFGVELPGVGGAMGLAVYDMPHKRYDGHSAYTNTTPAGAMRGFGNPQTNLAIERCVDEMALRLGMDPLKLREKNIMKAGKPWFLPYPCSSTALQACITEGAKAIGWERRANPEQEGTVRRGIGMAVGTHVSNAWPFCVDFDNAYVAVQVDGSLHLAVGVPDLGTGTSTSLPMVAAEAFGVALDKTSITFGDTQSTPFAIGSHASRTLYAAGTAVKAAAEDARAQILDYAAEISGLKRDDMGLVDGVVGLPGAEPGPADDFAAGKARAVTLADLCYYAHIRNKQFIGVGRTVPPNSPPWHACFADVSVDTETGQVTVNKLVAAHDVGVAIHPQIVEGQIEGGVVQGLGYALTEEITYAPDGRQNQRNMHTYMVPTAMDVPPIESIIVPCEDSAGPFGAKGAGECSLVCPASAIANAVSHALGMPVREIPLTPERVFAMLQEQ